MSAQETTQWVEKDKKTVASNLSSENPCESAGGRARGRGVVIHN